MATLHNTLRVIAKEALMYLESNLVLSNLVYRDFRQDMQKKEGQYLDVRVPCRLTAHTGAKRVPQEVIERVVTIGPMIQEHVSFAFNQVDLTMSINKYSELTIKPAVDALITKVEMRLAQLHKQVYNYVGVAGTTPSSFSAAAKLLDHYCVPIEDRRLTLGPDATWDTADALGGKYSDSMVDQALRKGYIGTIANCHHYMSQIIQRHTSGTGADTAGTPLIDTVAGTTFSGNLLHTDGWTAGNTLVEGDRFTVANCYSCHPQTKQSTGMLQRFVVTKGQTLNGSTTDDPIEISPSIVTSGAYQNVVAAPVDGSAIQTIDSTPDAGVEAAHVCNLMFNKNAFALVEIPIEIPESASFTARETSKNHSIMVVKDFDIDEYQEVVRLDILFAVKCINAEAACVILG